MPALTEDQMSPDASPGEVSKKVGVRRVNNMPVYIVGGFMAIFLLVMVLVASDRAEQQNRPAEEIEPPVGNTSMFAHEIAGDRKDGIIPPQAPKPLNVPSLTPATPGAIPVARPENLDIPPAPPNSAQQQQAQQQPERTPIDDERDRIRMAKLQQFEEAVKAKPSLPLTSARSPGSPPPGSSSAPATREETLARIATAQQEIDATLRDDPEAIYKARLSKIQAGINGSAAKKSTVSPALFKTSTTPEGENVAEPQPSTEQGDRWKLDSQPEAPRTPYVLRAGFVIPATLISGINSELPGQIVAQVSQEVSDTPIGKWPLIPQGSRLVGTYSSDVQYGQARVLIAWQRIIFPDGKAMDIGSMPGADSAGYSGFSDKVNNHYIRLFSSAFLMSGVTAGIALSQPQGSNNNNARSASTALSEALGQQLGQATAQLIAKNLSIAPTLEIRPGYRFNVIVMKDMTFSKPYKAFDY